MERLAETSETSGMTNTELVAALQNANEPTAQNAAMQQIMRQYEGVIANILHKFGIQGEAGDDPRQEIYIVILQKIGSIHDPAKFAGWIQEVARGVAFNFKYRHRELWSKPMSDFSAEAGEMLEPADKDEHSPVQQVIDMERQKMIEKVLQVMKRRDKIVLRQFYVEGLSLKSIGTLLRITEEQAKKLLDDARGRFEKTFKPMYENGGIGDLTEYLIKVA